MAVDTIDEKTGKGLTNEEIGELVICLLYVSSENTALGLTNLMVNLAQHPTHWKKAREEATKYLITRKGDIKGLMASKYMHSLVIETARLNSHFFSIGRHPTGW